MAVQDGTWKRDACAEQWAFLRQGWRRLPAAAALRNRRRRGRSVGIRHNAPEKRSAAFLCAHSKQHIHSEHSTYLQFNHHMAWGNTMKNALLILFLLAPMQLFAAAGEPLGDIDITVNQSPGGAVLMTGKTNGRGEFMAAGLSEGNYTVGIEMNGIRRVIGDQANDKITIPSASGRAASRPLVVALSSKSMFISKNASGRYQASSAREAGQGSATGRRMQGRVAMTNKPENPTSKASADQHSSRSNTAGSLADMHGTAAEDCDGTVEITPMQGGQMRVRVFCRK